MKAGWCVEEDVLSLNIIHSRVYTYDDDATSNASEEEKWQLSRKEFVVNSECIIRCVS